MTYWKMNPTIVQGTKLTALAGGIAPVPEKITGKLRNREMVDTT
jgi:hypothetical protein